MLLALLVVGVLLLAFDVAVRPTSKVVRTSEGYVEVAI